MIVLSRGLEGLVLRGNRQGENHDEQRAKRPFKAYLALASTKIALGYTTHQQSLKTTTFAYGRSIAIAHMPICVICNSLQITRLQTAGSNTSGTLDSTTYPSRKRRQQQGKLTRLRNGSQYPAIGRKLNSDLSSAVLIDMAWVSK